MLKIAIMKTSVLQNAKADPRLFYISISGQPTSFNTYVVEYVDDIAVLLICDHRLVASEYF